jgi:P4 family phage/plasmid primase-like protien
MLRNHPKYPDSVSTYDLAHRSNIFSFRVHGPRVCPYGIQHHGSNNFSIKILERNCFYYCHGSICTRLQKVHIGRVSLAAYLERASPFPVSMHDSSVMSVMTDSSDAVSHYARHETSKAAAHLYAAAHKDGRIMVDKNDEFWVWDGIRQKMVASTDIRLLAAEQLEFIGRAYNEQVKQQAKEEVEAVARECHIEDSEERTEEVEERPSKRRNTGGEGSEAAAPGKKLKLIDLRKFGNASFLDNTLRFAKALMKQVDLLDCLDETPTLLPCLNGVIDLETGAIMGHHPRFMNTKFVNLRYSPEPPASTAFRDFLHSIFNGDQEVLDYMQMLLGYFITADSSQSIFVVFTSPGGSGKSVLVSALRETLGDYFATLHKDVIVEGKQANKGAADPNMAALQGKRLAITEETGSLTKLDESTVKYLTGDSVVTCRDLFEKPRTFKLVAKVVVATNHPPKFDSTDFAMLRRLIYVPFPNAYVAPERFDPTNPNHRIADVTLNDRLKTPEAKQEALHWLVQGAVRFFEAKNRDGLVLHKKPKAFEEAMQSYVAENDPLSQWVSESCIVEKQNMEMTTQTSVLHEAYKNETQDYKMSLAMFGKQMKRMGFSNNDGKKLYIQELGTQVRVIQGIKLK